MAKWSEIEEQAPDLAARARAYFDAVTHKTLATVRRDGSPRISGTESLFVDGDLWFGSMWRARKALDLQRDPRFALHSGSIDPPAWKGDAKVSGRAVEVTDPQVMAAVVTIPPPGPFHLFRADVAELTIVSVNQDQTKLVIESWHEGRGVSKAER